MLHIDRRDDVDAGVEQQFDILPPLLVARPRRVGVGVLVDQDHAGTTAQDRIDIHLVKDGAAIFDSDARHHLEVAELSQVCSRPWVSTTPTTTSAPRSLRR